MTLKQLSCFPPTCHPHFSPPSYLTLFLCYQHCLSESLLISCGWSRRGALSSSSSITSHVSCQGNHLTESTIKDSSNLVVFIFCLMRATEMSSCIRPHVPISSSISSHKIWKQSLFIVRDERGKLDKLALWKLAEVNAIETICLCSLKGKFKILYWDIWTEFSAVCPGWLEWSG